jgi:hypothetical protein
VGWLYALHVRSSIARGRVWQAEYMLSGMRDQVLALMCLRHGVSAVEARGIDNLPPEATTAVAGALVRSLDAAELMRVFLVVNCRNGTGRCGSGVPIGRPSARTGRLDTTRGRAMPVSALCTAIV